MSGDYSKNSHNTSKSFSLVRMQQGRLFNDADFNELGDILRIEHREAVASTIGRAGFPESEAGFKLEFSNSLGGFTVGAGVAYVDGRRLVNSGSDVLAIKRKQGVGINTLWRIEAGPALELGDVLSPSADALGTTHIVSELSLDLDGTQLVKITPALSPNTRTEAHRLVTAGPDPDILPTVAGRYLAYLDTWEHLVTAVDDLDLLEIAFDGPDTATRDKTMWQVRFISEDDLLARGIASAPMTCSDFHGGLDLGDINQPNLRLAARASVSNIDQGPCTLPPSSGYRSLESHLYRVEIHGKNNLGTVHYKWSNDNGIHRTYYREIDNGALIADSIGRDDITSLKTGDWVEIRDEAMILHQKAGFFARISAVNDQRVNLGEIRSPETLAPITVNGAPNLAALPTNAEIRRWEGGLPKSLPGGVGWEELENGVEIRIEAGQALPGDYWTIPARSLSGDVVWPANEATGFPLSLPAEGISHAYAPLAVVTRAGNGLWRVESDCREIFSPLSEQVQFDYVSGDGQEARPNETQPNTLIALKQMLKVSVVRGKEPVAGVRVRFRVTAGAGLLQNNTQSEIVTTDADGIASINWRIDGSTPLQIAIAERLDSEETVLGSRMEFAATLSTAEEISYDPSNTPDLAGALTVQDALELLAGLQGGGCSTHVITPGVDWVSILETLQEDTDICICFAPGTYKTDRTVKMSGLGHVKITGSGPGVEILGFGTECALEIVDCDSLIFRDMAVRAPEIQKANQPQNQFEHRLGALTVTSTPLVEISNCAFECGPHSKPVRTGLTVRARPQGDTVTSLKSVCVIHSTFEVGYMQEGLLVHDSIDTTIADNTLRVAPIPDGFGLEGAVKDAKWRSSRVAALVNAPVSDEKLKDPDAKIIRDGNLTAIFASAIPQKEWDGLVKKSPPPSQNGTSVSKFKDYVNSLITSSVEAPDKLPTLHRLLDKNFSGGRDLDAKIIRSLIIGSELNIGRVDEAVGKKRDVLIQRQGSSVAFNSPMSQVDWERAVKAADSDRTFNPDVDLVGYVTEIADRLIVTPANRTGLNSFKRWFKKVAGIEFAIASQAIICVGRELQTVRIRDNNVRGFLTGIRAATSHGPVKGIFQIGSLEIDNNYMELTTVGSEIASQYGIYVGNVARLRLLGNTLENYLGFNDNMRFTEGVRIWGHLGQQLWIKENHIALITGVAFRIKGVLHSDSAMSEIRKRQHLWVLADNYAYRSRFLDRVSPSGIIRRRDNIS